MSKLKIVIIYNQIGFIIGSFITLLLFSYPEATIIVYLLLNVGYFMTLYIFYEEIKKGYKEKN